MLRSALILVLLLGVLPAQAAEHSSHTQVSANGTFSVRLVATDAGQCMLEVSRESGPAWTLKQCVGGVDDLYFVSNDGERVWVLYPLAPMGTRKLPGRKYRKVPAWANTVVAVEYDRQGRRVQGRQLLALVDPRQLSEVRKLSQHLEWLEGLLGVPGQGPRLTENGRIEFETVGGTSHQLTF